MRVSEQAEWPLGGLQRLQRVVLFNYVGVLVDRRTMANFNLPIDDYGSSWEVSETFTIVFR